jgi:predicted KAP-like P-loop ATPase
MEETNTMIKSDEPIRNPEDDQLGRANLAAVIAGEIRNIDASEGFVVGVLGPWGSGKTSLINLIRAELHKEPAITVLDFNPWMFSGADQLIERFFVELSEQLGQGPSKFEKASNLFAQYSKVVAPLQFVPVAGTLFQGVQGLGEAINALSEQRKGGIAEHRNKLADSLRELDAPIVVVIDDIDRLNTNEIRDIFKLVRLTAIFPNIIYIVAFDRTRIEHALSEGGLSGRDYLEKIIQAAYDIPVIPTGTLQQQLITAINEALESVIERGPFDTERWTGVLIEVIQPLFRSMRDVRRYAASLSGTVRSLEGRVSLVDVLGLEAIRVFLPDLFAAIGRSQDALTAPQSGFTDELNDPERKKDIEALFEIAGKQTKVVEALIGRLFPAAVRHLRNETYSRESQRQWSRDYRVAHPDFLAYYVERVAGNRLEGFWEAERAVRLLADSRQFEDFMQSIDPSVWEDVINALPALEETISPDVADQVIVALLNLLPQISDRQRGGFEPRPAQVVIGIIYRLLRRLPTGAIDNAVRSAFPQIRTLSGKLILLDTVVDDQNDGLQLVSENAAREFQAALRSAVREASPEALAEEPSVFTLLSWTKKTAEPPEPPFALPETGIVGGALLKGAVILNTYHSDGPIRSEKTLNWDSLVELVGGEQEVRRIADMYRGNGDDQSLADAVNVADQYLSGWRPSFP